jgi:NAD(P) transhydrogenase subunit alpha
MDEGGYAKEVDAETAAKQQEVLAEFVAKSDLVVTTAQIPGRPAPRLITAEVVASMHPGSVIVDMAASSGGNVEGSLPDEVVEVNGVRILGPIDLPSRVATDASRMYARNLQELVGRWHTDDGLTVDLDDEVAGPATITSDGAIINTRTRAVMGLEMEAT